MREDGWKWAPPSVSVATCAEAALLKDPEAPGDDRCIRSSRQTEQSSSNGDAECIPFHGEWMFPKDGGGNHQANCELFHPALHQIHECACGGRSSRCWHIKSCSRCSRAQEISAMGLQQESNRFGAVPVGPETPQASTTCRAPASSEEASPIERARLPSKCEGDSATSRTLSVEPPRPSAVCTDTG